jgi:hypothetical protein
LDTDPAFSTLALVLSGVIEYILQKRDKRREGNEENNVL